MYTKAQMMVSPERGGFVTEGAILFSQLSWCMLPGNVANVP